MKNSVKKIIVTSTSEVYGTAQYVPIDEDHHSLNRNMQHQKFQQIKLLYHLKNHLTFQ